MNELKKYILLCIMLCFAGIIFYNFYNRWTIILIKKSSITTGSDHSSDSINKKKITLHYFYQNRWRVEEQDQLWTNNGSKNLVQIINSWLSLLDEENILPKKTMLQSALVSQSGIAYLSFDHNIFSKKASTFDKWMLIEGLLRTLRKNNLSVQSVQLLLQHQQLNDPHLDFSMPWPITGFIII